ncbi:hypothetical protein M0R45_020194 [Rubus argutus]|uniref:Uncharacterized protein n=1 Tax=Rubus argutus TaxID=59490 RepID=A0AAW1X8H1_RUBAR
METAKEEKLSCREELEELGMIVPWCSQVEGFVKSFIGLFGVTHCGWEFKLGESGFWGVRVAPNEEGVVVGEELKRCLDIVMEVKR